MIDTSLSAARRRPFGLNAIIVTQVLLALLSAGLLVLAVFAVTVAYSGGYTDVLAEVNLGIDDLVTMVLMVIVNLVCAVGLWRRQRWAWFLTMLQLGVFMLSDLYSYFTGDPVATYAWSMLLNVIMVFYLNQREVQALFMAKPRSEPSAAPLPPPPEVHTPAQLERGDAQP